MKKLTESHKKKIKEYFTKKYKLNEGIIDYIFGRALVKKLKNDKEFVKLAKDLDSELQTTRDLLAWHAEKDRPVPADLLKLVPNLKIKK